MVCTGVARIARDHALILWPAARGWGEAQLRERGFRAGLAGGESS